MNIMQYTHTFRMALLSHFGVLDEQRTAPSQIAISHELIWKYDFYKILEAT